MKSSTLNFKLFLAILAVVAVHFFLDLTSDTKYFLGNGNDIVKEGGKIESFVIERVGEPTIRLVKVDGVWQVGEPNLGRANDHEIFALEDALLGERFTESFSEEEILRHNRSIKEYMQEVPRMKVMFVTENGKQETLSFGQLTPDKKEVYVMKNADRNVYTIPASIYDLFARPVKVFKQRRIISQSPDNVIGLNVKVSSRPILQFFKQNGIWTFGEDQVTSQPRFNAIIEAVCNAQAEDFVNVSSETQGATISSKVKKAYGLDYENAMTITVRCDDGREQNFYLGNDRQDGTSYALVDFERNVITINSSIKTMISEGIKNVSTDRAFPFERSKVTEMKIKLDATEYVLACDGGSSWHFEMPLSVAADDDKINAILKRVLDVKKEYACESGVEVSLDVSNKTFTFPKEEILQGYSMEDLRSKEMVNIDNASVIRIVKSGSTFDTQAVELDAVLKTWHADQNSIVKGRVDEESIKRILDVFNPLKAERIVKLKPSRSEWDQYGLDEPYMTIAIDVNDDNVPRKNVFIGSETTDGRYATIGSSESIFVISFSALEALKYDIILGN